MNKKQNIAAVFLILILGATVYGLIQTGQPPAVPRSIGGTEAADGTQAPIVDQSSLITAQKLAEFADKPEEQALSKEAIRLADHGLDLVYASAKRYAEAHPLVLNPEAEKIKARLEKAQKLQKTDQQLVAQLTIGETYFFRNRPQFDLSGRFRNLDRDKPPKAPTAMT